MRCSRSSGAIRRVCAAIAVTSLLALTGCSGAQSANASSKDTAKKPGAAKKTPQPTGPPLTVAVTPADKATKVLTSAEIAVNTTGTVEQVTLTSQDGKPVPGSLARDGKTWIPGVQLAYLATYRVAVKAKSGKQEKTVNSTFTTMAKPS